MPVKKKAAKPAASKKIKKASPPPKAKAAKASTSRKGNRGAAKAAPPKAIASPAARTVTKPAPEWKAQYQEFEKAINLFRRQQFAQARAWFHKAREGPAREIKSNADLHIKMCDRRLEAPPPAPKSIEEHYTYGVALINTRNLAEAKRHLDAALKLDSRADHVHYALGVCLALSGDLNGAYDSLKRAIELQPRNRMAARQDPDLEEIGRRQPLLGLLHTGG